jgi:hypothetical protein
MLRKRLRLPPPQTFEQPVHSPNADSTQSISQGLALQDWYFLVMGQPAPPFAACARTGRSEIAVPRPHVTLQSPHGLKMPTSQSITSGPQVAGAATG